MKKSLIVLTAALSFGFAAAQTAPAATQVPTLTDVPAGHWAKDAIDKIVAKGIILGYPDGTFRGTQNLTRYEAAVIIARLLDQVATGTVTTTDGTTTTLSPDDLTALQNAVQELAADLAALGVRVTDLESNSVSQDDFSRLEARVDALGATTGDPAALDALTQQIADVNARVDDLQANYDGLRADVDDNASSIAALNDLTVLLNNDILGLQDRVSAVETAQADFVTRTDFNALSTKVTGIDTRVGALEAAPKIALSGNFSVAYGSAALIKGTSNFDVDRLTRKTFADGVFGGGKNATQFLINPDGTVFTTGSVRLPYSESLVDFPQDYNDATVTFSLKASNLTKATGTLVVNDATVNFGVDAFGTEHVSIDSAEANGKLAGQAFKVMYDSSSSSFKFNDYLFNNDGVSGNAQYLRGAVATVDATNLPLSPKLTIVTGQGSVHRDPTIVASVKDANGFYTSATKVANDVVAGNYYGVRAEVKPFGLATIGLNYAQQTGNADYAGRSAIGVDANFALGPINLVSVYDISSVNKAYADVTDAFNQADKAFYVKGSADFGIAKVAANYRAIQANYAYGVAGMSANDAAFYDVNGTKTNGNSYGADTVGYGAGLATNLGPVTIEAFGDRKSNYAGTSTTYNTAYGVTGGVKLFGLKLVGFYNSAAKTTNNTVVHATGDFSYNGTGAYQDKIGLVPFAYSTTYGGVLSHDGAAADALVKGLSFTVADAYFYNDKINDFQAYGSYNVTLGGLTVTPFARYHSFNVDGNAKTVDGIATQTYTAAKYGVQITSAPLDIIGKPSLSLAFADSISNPGSSLTVTNNTKTELFGQAALTLNDLGVAGLSAGVGYAYYQGFKIGNSAAAGSASGGSATFSPTADRFFSSPLGGSSDPYTGATFGTANGISQGVFAQAAYGAFKVNYGVFNYTDLNNSKKSTGSAFKASYNFDF